MKDIRDISSLRSWEKNPRGIKKDDFARLKKQLSKFGQYKPLLITEDGTVLGGNMRLRALQEMGIKDVWVSVVSAPTEKEKIEYALSDNDRSGYYEEDKLAELVLSVPDFDLDEYKVDLGPLTSLSDLVKKFGPDDVEEDEPPEVSNEPPISKLGEVYQLGRHRLMCGDSIKIEDVEKLMDGKKADMVFTDPPYGLGGYGGRNMDGIMGNDVDVKQFYDACFSLHPFLTRQELYIWGGAENLRLHLDTKPRDVIVWVKNSFGLGAGYRGQYELCFYYGDFAGSDSDVWEEKKDTNYVHPTQKPLSLASRAIKNSEAKSVLDIFGGSGSTLVACEQMERTCYMMELDPKYCDVIRKRYASFIGKEDEWQTITPPTQ